jgi:hypothetical protein
MLEEGEEEHGSTLGKDSGKKREKREKTERV